MAKASTRQELIDYCLRQLGAPVLEVNVDDDQIDDLIDDAIQMFHERIFDGVEKMYLKYKITQDDIDRGLGVTVSGTTTGIGGTTGIGIHTTGITTSMVNTGIATYGERKYDFYENSNYIQVPDSVMGIEKIFKFDSSSISGGMFSIKYQLFMNDLYYFNSVELLQYSMTKTRLEDIDFLLSPEKQIRFNKRQDRLYLDLDWGSQTVGDYLIIDCYRALNPDIFKQVYNDMFVKLYATALIKKQWGQNLIKFRGTKLPGGIELNGREIYDDAIREIDAIRQRMTTEFELPPLDFIGWWLMALNPHFLQGSQGEQRLVQDLVNEHLKIYGVEVTYIPRKFVRQQTIIREVQSSVFDDNFLLEAYVNTFDGYGGQGDIMTKFGVSLRDELTVTISKERFEDFISPFLASDDDYTLSSRPREGDIIFFPLGQRLFEVKFVEHEQPFYQLGKNYVYQLKCELFEYEDEVLDTGIDVIDSQLEDIGYISKLQLIGAGTTATANAQLSVSNRGYIREIVLNDDGNGYTSTPNVAISTAPSAAGNVNATAVAITTSRGGVFSIDRIELTHAGIGYTVAPLVKITGGGGVGAAATAALESTNFGIVDFTMSNNGVGYAATPTVTIVGLNTSPAVAEANLLADGTISDIRLRNAGIGYTQQPTVTISKPSIVPTANPELSGVGNFDVGEIVRGVTSQIEARVKTWDTDTKILELSNVGIGTTQASFIPGEVIQATESTFFNVVTQVIGSCNGIQTTISVNSTAGIEIGMALKESFAGAGNTVPVIGSGSTVIAIGSGTISIHPPSICIPCPFNAVLSIGTTAYSNYVVDFFDEDNQNTTFESNEIIESEADDIIDFSEGNPFGTF